MTNIIEGLIAEKSMKKQIEERLRRVFDALSKVKEGWSKAKEGWSELGEALQKDDLSFLCSPSAWQMRDRKETELLSPSVTRDSVTRKIDTLTLWGFYFYCCPDIQAGPPLNDLNVAWTIRRDHH